MRSEPSILPSIRQAAYERAGTKYSELSAKPLTGFAMTEVMLQVIALGLEGVVILVSTFQRVRPAVQWLQYCHLIR